MLTSLLEKKTSKWNSFFCSSCGYVFSKYLKNSSKTETTKQFFTLVSLFDDHIGKLFFFYSIVSNLELSCIRTFSFLFGLFTLIIHIKNAQKNVAPDKWMLLYGKPWRFYVWCVLCALCHRSTSQPSSHIQWASQILS